MLKIWKKKEDTKIRQGVIKAEHAQPEDKLVTLPEQFWFILHA